MVRQSDAFKLPMNRNATTQATLAQAGTLHRPSAAAGNLKDFHALAFAACTGWPGWDSCGFIGSQVSAAPPRRRTVSEQMAGHRWGRVLLHAACAVRDHKLQWHWRGIRREFGSITVATA